MLQTWLRLGALAVLLTGVAPACLSGQAAPRPDAVEEIVGNTIRYLNARYGFATPGQLSANGFRQRTREGADSALTTSALARIAEQTGSTLADNSTICELPPRSVLYSAYIESLTTTEAVVWASYSQNTRNSAGTTSHRLRYVNSMDRGWRLAEELTTFHAHGDCRGPNR